MFKKILIANRGEIACRVIKTAKRLGIATVAVYSDADRDSLHVKQADEAVYIGAAPSSDSYLRGEKIIQVALRTGAQAIHPGYGFLSENAEFAQICADHQLVFIGPKPAAIKAMGSKSASKQIMQEAGIPLVPGYHGDDQDAAILKQAADDMGYPVLLKAVAGGGGKGMRQVWSSDEFEQGLQDAKREAKASFGNDDMLVEKYLTQPRHVEVQIFCDQSGNGVYLFERDCSVQRRHQKIIEEAPAPDISDELRTELGKTAVRAAQAIDYLGAGTVEFLLDADGTFYFMEMNTRLQVEHPVTEMITEQDLVEWQLKIANGEDLPLRQPELAIKGHAFEARIYAEDPRNKFLPTTGNLKTLITPIESGTIRVDTGVEEGDDVSPYYDPMIAKLVVWGEDREQALNRLATALRQYRIEGLSTNIDFLHDLATHPAFVAADLDTGFIDKHSESLFSQPKVKQETLALVTTAFLHCRLIKEEFSGTRRRIARPITSHSSTTNPWHQPSAWRMNQPAIQSFRFNIADEEIFTQIELTQRTQSNNEFTARVGDSTHTVVAELNDRTLTITINDHRQTMTVVENDDEFTIFNADGQFRVQRLRRDMGEEQDSDSDQNFMAPMNGTVIDILVKSGDVVEANQPVLIMEAMKMQHTMRAPQNGLVEALYCEQGDLVDGGTQLIKFVEQASELADA